MDDLEIIRRMIYGYALLFDTGDFAGFAHQFSHGRWYVAEPGSDGVLKFIDKYVLTYDGSPRTKHVTTNLIIDVQSGAQRATSSSYITVIQALPDFPLQPIFCGRYNDVFAKVGADWRWLERNVISDLVGDTSRHTRPRVH